MAEQLLISLLIIVVLISTGICYFFWQKYNKIKKELIVSTDEVQKERIKFLSEHLASEQKLNETLVQREEELTSNEEELRQSLNSQSTLLNEIKLKEASLKSLINNTNDLIFSIDTDYCLVDFNDVSKRFYNHKGAPFDKGFHVKEFVTAKNIERALTILDKVIKGEPQSAIFDIIEPDGLKNIYESYYNPIRNDKQEVVGISVMIRDVTEKACVLEALKASEEKYSKAFKSSPDSILITSVKNGRIVEINEGFLTWSGYTRKEVEGKSTVELGFWDLEERELLKRQLIDHGRVVEMEVHLRIKSGDVRTCLISAETLELDGELCLISVTRDITYKKKNHELLIELLNTEKQLNNELLQREEELSSSEEELRQSYESQSALLAEIQLKEANVSALMNNTQDMIYSIDMNYCVVEFNASMRAFTEERGEKIYKGIHISEFIDKGNLENALKTHDRVMNGETVNRLFDVTYGGSQKYFEGSYSPIINERKQVLGVSVVIRNITERKKAEDAIRASEEKYAIWFRSNPDPMTITTVEKGLIVDANDSFLKNLDLTLDEVLGKTTLDLNFIENPEEREKIREQIKKHGSLTNWELNTKRKNGEKRTVLLSAATFYLGGELCMITTARDITQLRRAEEDVRISNERLKLVIDNLPVAVWSVDKSGIITLSEGKALAEMGLKPGEHVGRSVYEVYGGKPEHTEYIKPVLEQGITVRRSDKVGQGYYEEIIAPIRNNNGEISGLIGVSFDITDVKKKEEELRRNEALLNNIIDHLPIGLQIFDNNGYSIKMNTAQQKLLGLKSKEDGIGKFNAMYDPVNSSIGASKIFKKAFEGEIVDNMEFSVDFRAIHNRGYTRNDLAWFSLWLYPIFDKNQQVEAIINLLVDITDRKLSEEKIEQKQQELIQVNKMMADYKLMALRSAMNPHFIFNAMNSIQYFISKNERENALIYLSLFSKLIRNILTGTVENKITIHREMETLQNYIELENLRFDMKFDVEYVIDESLDIRQIEIPSLLLQPYVENAILHGLYNKKEKGKLKIEITGREENTIVFVVEDNGVGREEARKIKEANQINSHKSVGMVLTKERLDIMNKTNNISVNITDLTNGNGKPAGTRIELFVEV